jgi:hypothetical protein
MTLRLTRGALALLLVSLLGASVTSAHGQSGSCSNRTIKGEYGFSYSGQVLVAPTGPFTQAGPVAGVAMFTFDGRGGLKLVDHTLYNGFLFPPAPFSNENTGTYNVNADCTGTFVIETLSLTASMVIMERGRIIHDVITNANTAITAVGIRKD